MTSTAAIRTIAILAIAALCSPAPGVPLPRIAADPDPANAQPAPVPAPPLEVADARAPSAAQPAEPAPRVRRRPPRELPPPALRLIVAKVDALPAAIDPGDPLWNNATSMQVALQPQTTTNPMLETATVQSVQVAALTDGKHIAWRMTWDDANPAMHSETGQFSDAAGVQFPLVPDAPYLMGAQDLPVHALYWRAQWQHDINHEFQDVQSTYPNAWSDLYWFSDGTRVPASFKDQRSHQWFIAMSAGNPMSDINRARPVEEITAEGFGTVTHLPNGIADGRGVWNDGRWSVVITREIASDTLSGLFAPGNASQFGIAIWDGDAGNVGGRKHHSLWVEFEVQR